MRLQDTKIRTFSCRITQYHSLFSLIMCIRNNHRELLQICNRNSSITSLFARKHELRLFALGVVSSLEDRQKISRRNHAALYSCSSSRVGCIHNQAVYHHGTTFCICVPVQLYPFDCSVQGSQVSCLHNLLPRIDRYDSIISSIETHRLWQIQLLGDSCFILVVCQDRHLFYQSFKHELEILEEQLSESCYF